MPSLPFYYEEILNHFYVLSRSRSFYSELVPTGMGGTYTCRRPNPIDIPTILSYNQTIVRVFKDAEFLDIVQTLDMLYIANAYKKKG